LTGAMGWLGNRPWLLVGLGLARERGECLNDQAFLFFLCFHFFFRLLCIGLSVFFERVISSFLAGTGGPYVEPDWIGKESGKLNC
jgi:hypothetical protein